MAVAKEVTLLTGFLGAGKTTLLNCIIAKKAEVRFAVVENEIGAENIDAELIVNTALPISELQNGCLCCSLSEDIFDVLNQLWDQRESWDHLIIEATGIADPANIAHPFLTNSNVRKGFLLKRVICVVDAELVEDQLREIPESISQIAFSDIILINKIEQVSPAYIRSLEQLLRRLNPFAVILSKPQTGFNVNTLFTYERFEDDLQARVEPIGASKRFSLVPGKPVEAKSGLMVSSHIRHDHSDIETIVLKYREPFELNHLQHRVNVFLILQSAGVYRIKGVIHVKGYPDKIILQTVGKSVAVHQGKTWETGEVRESKIVVIGKNLKVEAFDKMFKASLI
ncbi:GTP-binding protein [Pedobacter nutrimenti]|uniref:CobW family GTP-binding protein n=1 Tax=Pedobacter nutrimenti TaxID=1241337 RepID=UPI002931BC1B|nr:GTP-binding protein [Pedobacter nutrimenti]